MKMPKKSEIFLYWKEWLSKNAIDWGEPVCWSCEKPVKSKGKVNKLCDLWDKTNLQRCHVIPKSLGGTNDVSNLFLMCRDCHDEAPDTTSKEMFLKWVKTKHYQVDRFNEILKHLEMLGFDLSNENVINDINNKMRNAILNGDFNKFANENLGTHFNQNNKGGKIKNSSFAVGVMKYINDGSININIASADDISKLQRIGKNKADRIIIYRNKIGSFKSLEQLLEVKGIGKGILDDIINQITI